MSFVLLSLSLSMLMLCMSTLFFLTATCGPHYDEEKVLDKPFTYEEKYFFIIINDDDFDFDKMV